MEHLFTVHQLLMRILVPLLDPWNTNESCFFFEISWNHVFLLWHSSYFPLDESVYGMTLPFTLRMFLQCETRRPLLFIDLHGHSRRSNCFLYGNNPDQVYGRGYGRTGPDCKRCGRLDNGLDAGDTALDLILSKLSLHLQWLSGYARAETRACFGWKRLRLFIASPLCFNGYRMLVKRKWSLWNEIHTRHISVFIFVIFVFPHFLSSPAHLFIILNTWTISLHLDRWSLIALLLFVTACKWPHTCPKLS